MSEEHDAIKNFEPITIRPLQNGYEVTVRLQKQFAFNHFDEMQEFLYRFWHTNIEYEEAKVTDEQFGGKHE